MKFMRMKDYRKVSHAFSLVSSFSMSDIYFMIVCYYLFISFLHVVSEQG